MSLSTRESKTPPALHAFTVDVEDYFQVTAFEKVVPRTAWESYSTRVEASTQRLLEMLAARNVRGTFFVLGWIADKFPRLVREIHAAGHELGTHSYWHRLVYSLTSDEFRQDLRDSKKAIENASGVRVNAFRAPSFSITQRSLWALDILVEEGITIDSSIFPTRHDRYGIPGAREDIHTLELNAGRLTEFPPTVARCAGLRLPMGGGGYFRLYPWSVTHYFLRQVARQRPFMFYVHPWEVDPDQPRIACGSRLSTFRHYVNLPHTYDKLGRLLDSFPCGSLGDVLQQASLA